MNVEIQDLEEDDRVLFNDRTLPLTVTAVDENRVHVDGPRGGEYIIFPAENDPDLLLVANKGSREYASKVENLRKTGEWVKESENEWRHTKSERTVKLVKNETGFWTIETGLEIDLPKYGYSNREAAVEEAEELVEKNPEG